eukprot:UN3396
MPVQWSPDIFAAVPSLRCVQSEYAEQEEVDKAVADALAGPTCLRRFFMNKLNACRSSTKRRNSKRQERGLPLLQPPTISVQWLIRRYREQLYRCHYSNIPMSTTPSTRWLCSVERLNSDWG